MTGTKYDAGDPAQHGSFRQNVARARPDALFGSPAASRLHTAYLHGLVLP